VITVIVHTFTVGDVEDPEIYAASPILDWQNTDKGTWVMEHSIEPPIYMRAIDHNVYGYKYCIRANLKDEDALYYKLRWGS